MFDYDYNTMKSGPEIVSVSTDNMLELLYPLRVNCGRAV